MKEKGDETIHADLEQLSGNMFCVTKVYSGDSCPSCSPAKGKSSTGSSRAFRDGWEAIERARAKAALN